MQSCSQCAFTAHFLNLIDKNALESCHSAAKLFDLLKSMHPRLVASSNRCQVRKNFLDGLRVNKVLSDAIRSVAMTL